MKNHLHLFFVIFSLSLGCSTIKTIDSTLTNSVNPILKNANSILTNDLHPTLSNLNLFVVESTESIVETRTNINNLLISTKYTIDSLHGSINNINKLAVNANILVNKLNHTQDDIKDFVPKWIDRSRLILEILLGGLAIYAFRRKKIDEDIRNVYKKSKMKLSTFFN